MRSSQHTMSCPTIMRVLARKATTVSGAQRVISYPSVPPCSCGPGPTGSAGGRQQQFRQANTQSASRATYLGFGSRGGITAGLWHAARGLARAATAEVVACFCVAVGSAYEYRL
eukprot:SAG25_NODE_8921_length_397_cov_0.667785_1_plen_114_part_01